MENLVFLAPNTKEPFTTSEAIALAAQVKHHAVQQMIQKHESDFKEFGRVAFEMRACPHRTGASMEKIYHLNEQQATLLMTYLRNTEVVRKFKMELVRQFFAMRQELQKVQAAKVERKSLRANMLAEIAALPESPNKKWKYAQFSNLAYISALGKTASVIRKERGARPTATASDFLTAAEIERVAEIENKIGVLVSIGMEYAQVKAALRPKAMTA